MAGRIKGITIEIGGNTTKLQKSLKQVDTKLRSTEAELRDVNKLLRFSPRSTELLAQKQQLLKTRVQETSARLEQLKETQKQMSAKGIDRNSEQYRALEREIAECSSKLETFKAQQKSFGSVGLQQVGALGNKYKELGDSMKSVGSSLTTNVTMPIALGFGYAAKQASDFDENINKVDVAFGNSSKQVKEWAKNATASFGLSQNSALEMTSQFGDMGTSMGLTSKEAADMSMSLAGLAGDLSSFKNIDVEQAMTALNGVFTGETESLKTLGIVMTQTNLDAFALANGFGKTTKDMTEAEKVALRYAYVMDKTKNAQGDYARTSDGTANSIRTLQESLKNLAVVIGQNILPIITPVIQKITKVIQKIGELSPTMQKVIVIAGLIAAAIGPVLLIAGQLITSIGSIMTLVSTVGPMLTPQIAIIAGVAAALVAVWASSEKLRTAVAEAGKQIKAAFVDMIAAAQPLLQNLGGTLLPVVKNVLAAVGAVLARLVPIITKVITVAINGATRNIKAVTSMFNVIKSVASKIYSVFVTPIQNAYNTIRNIINKIKSLFSSTKFKFNQSIALPHFSLSGIFDAAKNKVPKASVRWFGSAMEQGTILRSPTIFGAAGNKLLGGGEVGNEVIVGQGSLFSQIQRAVSNAMLSMANNMAGAVATAVQMGMSGQSASGEMTMQVYLYPNGPKMGEYIVDAYDTYKKRLG